MKTYVTFGFDHTHDVNGHTLDKDCVAVITSNSEKEGRDKAFELFGREFCMEYSEDYFAHDHMMQYFPRGLIEL